MQRRRTAELLLLVGLTSLLGACSNFPSRQPPIWVWTDMKKQDKYKPQAKSQFFADGRTSRRPVAETVSEEGYRGDVAYATGVGTDQKYVAKNPEPLNKETLERGQRQFNIYCAPCHDQTGAGKGVVPAKVTWVPGNLHDPRIEAMVDGELYHVISSGRRSMPGYRFQMSEKDRWATVAYIRALQRSWHGTMADVPAEMQGRIR